MPGTLTDARRAYNRYGIDSHEDMLSNDGCSRRVYLIGGIVYKVDRYPRCMDNYNEYKIINAKRDILPTGVFYPQVSLFEVEPGYHVIAMDYIDGTACAECYCVPGESCQDDCMPHEIETLVMPFLNDSAGLNVIYNSDGIYIIDAL